MRFWGYGEGYRMFGTTSKSIALLTVVMSIPLLLSYSIKYGWFPQGLPFLFLFFWGLLSVWVVPLLLVVDLAFVLWISGSSDVSKKPFLRWNLLGLAIAVMAELMFVAARYSPT